MRRLTLIAPLFLTAAAQAEPGFWMVHKPGDPQDGRVHGLSQNGLIAVGYSSGLKHVAGFWWTAATGRYDYGLERGMPEGTGAYSVSSDGGVIVGWTREKVPPWEFDYKYRAYRKAGNGPLDDLGLLPNWNSSTAMGVSGDGTIVIGTCHSGGNNWSDVIGEPFRWTQQTGMVGLGKLKPSHILTEGLGISRDGTTIVGRSGPSPSNPMTEAYFWTEQTGMVQLPCLPDILADDYGALAVNADGSVIVGYVADPDIPNKNYPVRWVNGEIEDLGSFGPYGGGRMYAVDDSGNVIGGGDAGATVWTPATGLMLLEDYLAGFGLKGPEGLTLAYVTTVSGDGLTVGGYSFDKGGHTYGFVATIPAPCAADCDQSGQLDIDDFICFQTLFGLGDMQADCDQSGGLDIADFACFSAAYAVGCP